MTDASRVPLPTLLSQVFVAWTIELDNLVESVAPHRTTGGGSAEGGRGPWLTSVAMYWTCLRHLDDDGTTLGELTARVGTATNLNGLRRWGYVTVDGAPTSLEPVRPKPDLVVRPTEAGRRMRGAWREALAEVERRWRSRLGVDTSEGLVGALAAVDVSLDPTLPDCLPILGYGLSTSGLVSGVTGGTSDADEPRLPILVARVLLAFALEVDEISPVPIAIGSNLLRVLTAGGERSAVRELPARTGTSKEALAMAIGVATKRGWITSAKSADGRMPIVRWSAAGTRARDQFDRVVDTTETQWRDRFGAAAVDDVRSALADLVEPIDELSAPIHVGLAAPPGGWRSKRPPIQVLPHFPMVLHRGGWPDGA